MQIDLRCNKLMISLEDTVKLGYIVHGIQALAISNGFSFPFDPICLNKRSIQNQFLFPLSVRYSLMLSLTGTRIAVMVLIYDIGGDNISGDVISVTQVSFKLCCIRTNG